MVHHPDPGPGDADLSFTLTKPQLLAMLAGGGLEGVEHQGDPGALQRLMSVLEDRQAQDLVAETIEKMRDGRIGSWREAVPKR